MQRTMTDEGYINLVHAMVSHARSDIMYNPPGSSARIDAEAFFHSPWFEQLTGGDGKAAMDSIHRQLEKKMKMDRRHVK